MNWREVGEESQPHWFSESWGTVEKPQWLWENLHFSLQVCLDFCKCLSDGLVTLFLRVPWGHCALTATWVRTFCLAELTADAQVSMDCCCLGLHLSQGIYMGFLRRGSFWLIGVIDFRSYYWLLQCPSLDYSCSVPFNAEFFWMCYSSIAHIQLKVFLHQPYRKLWHSSLWRREVIWGTENTVLHFFRFFLHVFSLRITLSRISYWMAWWWM